MAKSDVRNATDAVAAADKRTQNTLSSLRVLANIGRPNWSLTAEQKQDYLAAVRSAVDAVEASLTGGTTASPFTLKH